MTSFLQSQNWLEFQGSLGRRAWQVNSVNVIEHSLPLGKTYLYTPRATLPENFKEFVEKIKEIAKKENAIFFKLEPESQIDLEKYGLIKSNNIQPIKTIILDTTKTEQELLGAMHYKTRYNIQLAQKKNIKIKRGKQYFDSFWELIGQTAKRDGFKPYPKEYYKKMLEIPNVELFAAEFPANGASQNKIIAANIVVFHEKTCIYLHGASDYEHRNLMASYLLQWEQIKEAKKRGFTEYDFWGINEKKWPGVTRFKKGFGGTEINYPGAFDLIFQPIWYWIYKITGMGNRVLTKLIDML